MAHAEKCPICEGKGVVMGIAETGTQPTQRCHGCYGRGWVEVGIDYPQPFPFPWQTYTALHTNMDMENVNGGQ